MDNRRRFKRIDCGLNVTLKDQRGTHELQTSNVSLHGVHIITDHPPPMRQLVQLNIDLGSFGAVEVMGMVAWHQYSDDEDGAVDGLPGMGIEFFAMSVEHKNEWTQFIHALRAAGEDGGPAPSVVTEPPTEPPGTEPTPHMAPPPIPEAALGEPPVRRKHPRYISCFMLQLRTRQLMRDMYTRDISVGGMFVQTPAPERVNKDVQLVLVHPATKEEFQLAGQVVRVQKEGNPKDRGVALQLPPMPPEREAALLAFIESGVNFLRTEGGYEWSREVLLKRTVELVGDSAPGLLLLGQALLKSQDMEVALQVFKKAAGLSPENMDILKGLHEAALINGDQEAADGAWSKLQEIENQKPKTKNQK